MKFLWGLLLVATPALGGTYTFVGGPLSIPESGPADPSFLYVEGVEGKMTSVTVKLNNFSHRYGEETMIALSNPDGWATLIYDAPDCVITSADLVFYDEAPDWLGDKCTWSSQLNGGEFRTGYSAGTHEFTIPIAPIRPLFETLAELFLEDPNGRWILWSEDFVGGDGGTADSWELIIETEDAPDPDDPVDPTDPPS